MTRWTYEKAQEEAGVLGFQLWRGTLRRVSGYSATSHDGSLHVVGPTLHDIVERMRAARKLTCAQKAMLEAIRVQPKYDSDFAEVVVTGAQKITARNLRKRGLVWIDAPDGALGPFYVSLTR